MDNEFLEIVNKTDRIIKFSGILVFYPNEPVKVSGKTKEQVPAIDILIKRGDFEIVGGSNEGPKMTEKTERHETDQGFAETKRTHKTERNGKKAKRSAKTAEEMARETEKEETPQTAEEMPLGDSLDRKSTRLNSSHRL